MARNLPLWEGLVASRWEREEYWVEERAAISEKWSWERAPYDMEEERGVWCLVERVRVWWEGEENLWERGRVLVPL